MGMIRGHQALLLTSEGLDSISVCMSINESINDSIQSLISVSSKGLNMKPSKRTVTFANSNACKLCGQTAGGHPGMLIEIMNK